MPKATESTASSPAAAHDAGAPAAALTHVLCGSGGLGPAPPEYVAVVLVFDLAATRDIEHVRVTSIEFLDPSGKVVQHSKGPLELRVVPSGPPRLDLPDGGGASAGRIPRGSTVRLRAAGDMTPMPGAFAFQLRYRASVVIDAAPPLSLEGVVEGPWATAGPAPIPR